MNKQIPFEKIIRAAQRFGADFADVFVEQTRHTTIICDNNKIEHIATTCDYGIGIRVIASGRSFYASTNNFTQKNLISITKELARSLGQKKKIPQIINLKENPCPPLLTIKQHPTGINLDNKCSMVSRANEAAWLSGQAVKQVKISYRDTVRKIIVAASDGTFVNDEQISTIFNTHVVASSDTCLQTGYESMGGTVGFEIFDDIPPEEIANRAAKRAIKMLKARPAPAGTMNVVLSSEAGGTMIHEAVGHGLEGDGALEGLSVYSEKIGEMVANPIISVVDDATRKGNRGSFTFDDEGSKAKRNILIENGVLKGYLSSKLTNIKFGVPSTGNGRRQTYEYPPIVRMTNTFILPGKDQPDAILRDTNTGFYVKKMGGGQVNTTNGDFVFDVQEGYLIEGGKLSDMVRGATLIGNGPKVLKLIDRVGSDLGFSVGTCGKNAQEAPVSCGQPTLRITELVVGGTEK